MKKSVMLMALIAFVPMAQADDDVTSRVEASRTATKSLMMQLKTELQAAMKAGGPVNALEVCNDVAPKIASKASAEKGWDVGRTSLKTRNPGNAADAWEATVLKKFDERKAAGEDPKKMEYYETVEEDGKKSFRYMKAIPTGEVCLKCHGEKVKPELQAKLEKLYPEDQALGYKMGDIRGAFTIKQPY